MPAPPHSLHSFLRRWCGQISAPSRSLHLLLIRCAGKGLPREHPDVKRSGGRSVKRKKDDSTDAVEDEALLVIFLSYLMRSAKGSAHRV
jgi:hypothetical protein